MVVLQEAVDVRAVQEPQPVPNPPQEDDGRSRVDQLSCQSLQSLHSKILGVVQLLRVGTLQPQELPFAGKGRLSKIAYHPT